MSNWRPFYQWLRHWMSNIPNNILCSDPIFVQFKLTVALLKVVFSPGYSNLIIHATISWVCDWKKKVLKRLSIFPIHLEKKNQPKKYDIYNFLTSYFNKKEIFSPKLFWGKKIQLFYFLYIWVTSFGQALINLHELQMVSDILGNPVSVKDK